VLNTAVGDAKTRQMEGYTQHQDKNTPLTTYFGTKMAETDVALRAGARGPTVLEGAFLRLHTYFPLLPPIPILRLCTWMG